MTESDIFLAAVEKDDPTERVAYLDEACGADVSLRQRVEALLRSHERAADFMEVPVGEQLEGDGGGLDFLAPSQKSGSLGRLAHYEVLEVVGRGGMGVVLRAFDTKLHRVVAIKALAPQLATSSAAWQRFVREARAAAAVTHDNVIDIHAVEDSGPMPYLVMQFIDGPTLQQKLDRTGQLSLKEILRIGLQIAEGLAAAHRHGVIHRDVKPANILFENGIERVKLTDFGLARAGDDSSLTQSGLVAGTPMYMSPEQAQGEPVDFRSDLFSLGSVLYALCTGRPPFRAPSAVAVLKRVCEETPRPIRESNPELPPWLEELVARLHAKAPADRFASAQEVADLLARRLAELQQRGTPSVPGQPPAAELPGRKPALAPPSRPRRLRVLAAAVLLALLAGLGLSEATGITKVRGPVLRLFLGEGTLIVEVDDPGVSVSLNGEELVITGAGVREIRLKPGRYEMKATKEGKLIQQELVTVTKDGKRVVRVSREPAPAQVAAADAAAWERRVAALPAEEQIKAVAARLGELNPDFDGKVTPTIDSGVVTELKFAPDHVTNLAPVRALSQLAVLDCRGPGPKKGPLADLSPLKGMPLTYLDCSHSQVSDLSPLRGMPLHSLQAEGLRLSDLSPLRGMRLANLGLFQTNRVSDLSPLKGMPLVYLNLAHLPVSDLSLLKGMTTLRTLVLDDMPVSDLSPLSGLPLESLRICRTRVSDLSPLKGMSLKTLLCNGTSVSDLSPLKGMPLTYLDCSHSQVSDLSPLRGMPLHSLQAEGLRLSDLSPLRGMRLANLGLFQTNRVSDLSPLKGMPLVYLNLAHLPVSDLSLLKGMTTLRTLVLDDMPVSDLSPLSGLPLESLRIYRTRVSDLTPLKGMPLRQLGLDFRAERDTEVLRSLTGLQQINDMPAAEFWKAQKK